MLVGEAGDLRDFAGAIDTFLVDKIIPEPGPVSFIGATYPSIFTGK